ncbi:MAG: hypothetical protein ACRD0K_23370 [Egibacteraceae bacterium]
MDDVTMPALMLVAASMCVLAVVWVQQRVIVRLERRVADLADAVLAPARQPRRSLPAPPSDQSGGGGPNLRSPGGAPPPPPDARGPTPAAVPRVASLRPEAPPAAMGQPLTGRE